MIKVKKIREGATLPQRVGGRQKSAWMDLTIPAVSVNGELRKPLLLDRRDGKLKRVVEYRLGDTVTLHTGLAMELSDSNKEGWLLPRSSTYKKTGLILSNSKGIIDYSYYGDSDEWMAVCYATRDGFVEIGERYLQFREIDSMEDIEIQEVDYLGNENRNGFGSTDKEER